MRIDWNLRSCSRSGHVTYAPDEAELRQRLASDTPASVRPGAACGAAATCSASRTARGPAEDAPVLLRGKALRSAFILRLLADRAVRSGAC